MTVVMHGSSIESGSITHNTTIQQQWTTAEQKLCVIATQQQNNTNRGIATSNEQWNQHDRQQQQYQLTVLGPSTELLLYMLHICKYHSIGPGNDEYEACPKFTGTCSAVAFS